MRYTVIGHDAYLELTRTDLVTLLAKLDDNDDCTMRDHDTNVAWLVITVTALEDEPAASVNKPALSDLTVDSCHVDVLHLDRGE